MEPIFNIFGDNAASSSDSSSVTSSDFVYIFAYGSLIWKPGFEFIECLTGYIRGYTRKFWQGNVTHRGSISQPGRVVTLIEEKHGITWGCAYKVSEKYVLEYLEHRECVLGGYEIKHTKFFPRVASEFSGISGEAFSVTLYIATPSNSYWLGDERPEIIAKQIFNACGPSGHNIEYLLRLALFMREEISNIEDDHLFGLEKLVREEMNKQKICFHSVMGQLPQNRIQRDYHENFRHDVTFAHSSRVPEKKLRCLNI